MDKYDLVVVGAGPGGYVAAIRAAQLGFKTALIDKKESLGGTCLNVGCIPSKALLRSSELYDMGRTEFADHGITFDRISFDFSKMQARRLSIIEQFRKGIAGLLQKNKVVLIEGQARFIDAKTLEIIGSGTQIQGDKILLATGSLVTGLPHIPFDGTHIFSSTEALELKEVPETLAIIGGGVIGLEIGSIYQRLGSKVTVLEALDRLCATMDPDISKEAQKLLGLDVRLNQKVTAAKVESGKVKITTEGGELIADKLLIAVGRKPNTASLNLAAAGITCNDRGVISINDGFQTTNPAVYAIGDIVPGPMLAHKASIEAVALVESFKGMASKVCYMAIPSIMYTSPEMAQVGLDEASAAAAGLQYQVGKTLFRHQSRAVASHHTDGFVKLIVEKGSRRLLGGIIVAEGAGELIHFIGLMITHQMTLSDLLMTPFGHPTLAEAIFEAAAIIDGRAVHA